MTKELNIFFLCPATIAWFNILKLKITKTFKFTENEKKKSTSKEIK